MLVFACMTILFLFILGIGCIAGGIGEHDPIAFWIGLGFVAIVLFLVWKIDNSYGNTVYEVVESKEYTVYPVEATAVIAVGSGVRQLGPPYCGWEKVRIDTYEDGTDDWFDFGGYEEMVNPLEDKE